ARRRKSGVRDRPGRAEKSCRAKKECVKSSLFDFRCLERSILRHCEDALNPAPAKWHDIFGQVARIARRMTGMSRASHATARRGFITESAIGAPSADTNQLIRKIEQGLPMRALESLALGLEMGLPELAALLGIPGRT